VPAPLHLHKQVLQLAHRVYMAQHKYHDALRVALRLNEPATIESTFAACSDVLERRQLGYLLARHGAWGAINLEEGPAAVEVSRVSCHSVHCFACVLYLLLLQRA
jgi:hypothetical protein